jgi:hypothetical protein
MIYLITAAAVEIPATLTFLNDWEQALKLYAKLSNEYQDVHLYHIGTNIVKEMHPLDNTFNFVDLGTNITLPF